MDYIQPKNWTDFQHYKDRSPSWIKLHKSLLDNYEFHCLQLASKALAPLLWLLASEYENGKIPYDCVKIAYRLRVEQESISEAISDLIHSGFFICYQGASEVLADCLPRGEDIKQENKKLMSSATAADPCPHQKIIDLYHEILPVLPRVREWTPARQTLLRSRWKEKPERQSLDWWRDFFQYVAQSDFLCGRVAGRNGNAPWQSDLEWLVRPSNLVKVIEGKYENAGANP